MPPTQPHRGGPASNSTGRVAGKTIMGGKLGAKRHRKILRDSIHGISKCVDLRLARRGGVKRISATIYEAVRAALKTRLEMILRDCVIYVEHRNAKTITVNDVIYSLRRIGQPIYGFDPDSNTGPKKAKISTVVVDKQGYS
ncbi:histone-fold-containing protein [Mariannaea sp. PMI_226]|nr:histone-fold-containing protein [Mariannaea sp. PMI_226]